MTDQVQGETPDSGGVAVESPRPALAAGLTAGFHYGTIYSPCNGVLHWINEFHTDGRQLCECDACGTTCVQREVIKREVEHEAI